MRFPTSFFPLSIVSLSFHLLRFLDPSHVRPWEGLKGSSLVMFGFYHSLVKVTTPHVASRAELKGFDLVRPEMRSIFEKRQWLRK